MDTRFWGKDGWKFLHSIAYCYKENEKSYQQFFKSIQHVLPCIYCRRSYKKYITELPVDTKHLTKWLYMIHNRVNEKLRKQGYNLKTDPSLAEVDEYYNNLTLRCTTGFRFLYCILFNYHLGISNVRKKGYITFFNTLKDILPTKKLRSIYSVYIDEYPFEELLERVEREQNVEPIKKWIHQLEKRVSKCKPFRKSCQIIENYRVDKCIGETCQK